MADDPVLFDIGTGGSWSQVKILQGTWENSTEWKEDANKPGLGNTHKVQELLGTGKILAATITKLQRLQRSSVLLLVHRNFRPHLHQAFL